MINSRSPADLAPEVQSLLVKLVGRCAVAGLKILITSTYRDDAMQNELYAQGRTKPGKIVTNAKAGQSAHNDRCAFDFCIIGPDGKPDWNDTTKYKAVGAIGESIGLEWGGNFKSFPDLPHFQIKGWKARK